MYRIFLEQDALNSIKLPIALQNSIEGLLEMTSIANSSPNLLDNVLEALHDYAWRHLENDIYPRFRKSDLFEKFVDRAKQESRTNATFGIPLEDIMSQQRKKFPKSNIPHLVKSLVRRILQVNAKSVEGIFRISAASDELKRIRHELDIGNFECIETLEDPHLLTGILRKWLRDIPQPLFPFHLYDTCLDACDDPNAALEVVSQLPKENRHLLEFLFQFLREFIKSDVVAVTLMDLSNISTIFSPCLIRSPPSKPLDQNLVVRMDKERKFIHNLLKHYSSLPVKDSESFVSDVLDSKSDHNQHSIDETTVVQREIESDRNEQIRKTDIEQVEQQQVNDIESDSEENLISCENHSMDEDDSYAILETPSNESSMLLHRVPDECNEENLEGRLREEIFLLEKQIEILRCQLIESRQRRVSATENVSISTLQQFIEYRPPPALINTEKQLLERIVDSRCELQKRECQLNFLGLQNYMEKLARLKKERTAICSSASSSYQPTIVDRISPLRTIIEALLTLLYICFISKFCFDVFLLIY